MKKKSVDEIDNKLEAHLDSQGKCKECGNLMGCKLRIPKRRVFVCVPCNLEKNVKAEVIKRNK